MHGWLYPIIMASLAIAAAALLYRGGLAQTKCIAAVLYVFRPGRTADRVTVNACTGRVRHAGRFRESGTYTFTLDAQLSKGTAEVALLDHAKRPLLRLDRQSPEGTIALDARNRYHLRWDFAGATGKCALRWRSAPPTAQG